MSAEKKNYINNGYCLIKKNFFSLNETIEIEKILDNLIESQNPNLEIDNKVMGGKSLALQNFIDENIELKNYINRIFTDKEIIFTIKNNVGENFKITDIVYRKSYPGDIGLDIHQDADGENTIVLNLSNVEDYNGKTFFIKSSHKCKSIRNLIKRDSISFRLNKFFKFFFDFADCSRGSILMFDNKVFHGRFSNQAKSSSNTLLIGVYKEGSTINYDQNKNGFKKNINKLDLKKYELDIRRNLGDDLVEAKGADNYYLIPEQNKKISNEFLINKKYLKTMIYIILIKFIYFFKGA